MFSTEGITYHFDRLYKNYAFEVDRLNESSMQQKIYDGKQTMQ
jgi:hypothetical protein